MASSEWFADDNDSHSNSINKLKENENYQNNNLSSLLSYAFFSEIIANTNSNQINEKEKENEKGK